MCLVEKCSDKVVKVKEMEGTWLEVSGEVLKLNSQELGNEGDLNRSLWFNMSCREGCSIS